MMFGPWEIVLIGAIAAVVFGPSMFQRAGSSLGQGLTEFKKAVKEEDQEKEPEAAEEDEAPSRSEVGGESR